MFTRFKPTLAFSLKILNNLGAETKKFNFAVEDKVTGLQYIDKDNKVQTVSGKITGMAVDVVPNMPYENGSVDLTPHVLSSFEIDGKLKAVNDGKYYVVKTLRLDVTGEDGPGVYHSLYIPVDKITDVGAVAPANTESDSIVISSETVNRDGSSTHAVAEVSTEGVRVDDASAEDERAGHDSDDI